MIGEKTVARHEAVQFAQGLDAQGMRRDVDEDRADVDSGDQPPLHRRAHGHGQVGLDLRVHGPAQPLFQQLVDQRSAGCSADQDDLVDLVGLQLGVGQGFVEAGQRLQEERMDQFLVLAAADLHADVQRLVILVGDEFFLDGRDGLERQPLLGFLDGVEQAATWRPATGEGRCRASC